MKTILAYFMTLIRRPKLRPGAAWKSEAGVRNLALNMRRLT